MSLANPTPLRVGASGSLHGWRVHVAGRVVVGMQEGGETYCWNEFNLKGASGNSGTLVYEATEHGHEWKLFRAFQPVHALSAREAATKRVGDVVNLDGTPTRITLVDNSRVYHIEGEAPEGVEVGDVAHYFNAGSGPRLLVASWTGDEIEIFEGQDVPAELVAEAFNFPTSNRPLPAAGATARNLQRKSRRISVAVVLAALGLGVIVAFWIAGRHERSHGTPASAQRVARPTPRLRLRAGADGILAQRHYTIEARAFVDVARISGRHGQHEYHLRDGDNGTRLLVNAPNGDAGEWILFEAVTAQAELPAMTPFNAAERRKAAAVVMRGRTFRINDLLRAQTIALDGPGAASLWPAVQYGFTARDGDEWLLARWTETGIRFYRGKAIAASSVLTAFGPAVPQ